LVDDGLVDSDKIGTSVYFWAFPRCSSYLPHTYLLNQFLSDPVLNGSEQYKFFRSLACGSRAREGSFLLASSALSPSQKITYTHSLWLLRLD
jgi:hypothetical protein